MKIKGLIIGLMICSLCSAQETAEGLPALLQAPNGKSARVRSGGRRSYFAV